MEEIYFCATDLNGVSGLMRLAKFDFVAQVGGDR